MSGVIVLQGRARKSTRGGRTRWATYPRMGSHADHPPVVARGGSPTVGRGRVPVNLGVVARGGSPTVGRGRVPVILRWSHAVIVLRWSLADSSPGRTSVIRRDRIPPVRGTKPNQALEPSPGSHPAGSRYEAESGREAISQGRIPPVRDTKPNRAAKPSTGRSRPADDPSVSGRPSPKKFWPPTIPIFSVSSKKVLAADHPKLFAQLQKSLATIHPKKFLFMSRVIVLQGRVPVTPRWSLAVIVL